MDSAYVITSATWRPHGDSVHYEGLPMLRGTLHVRADASPAVAVIELAQGSHVDTLVELWTRKEAVDVRLALQGYLVDNQEIIGTVPVMRSEGQPTLVVYGLSRQGA